MPLAEGYSAPFPDLGNPRIIACLRLPEAYRSLATSFFGSWCQGIPTCTRGSLTKFTLEIVSRRDAHTHLSKNFFLRITPEKQTGLRLHSHPARSSISTCHNEANAASRGSPSHPLRHTPLRAPRHPLSGVVETIGLEPTTSWLQTRRSTN